MAPPRRKASSQTDGRRRVTRKRGRRDEEDEEEEDKASSPSKRRRSTEDDEDDDEDEEKSPTRRKNKVSTPRTRRSQTLSTPNKTVTTPTPNRRHAIDKSARRKSTRALIKSAVGDGNEEDEEDEEDEIIARTILHNEEDSETTDQGPTTPSSKHRAAAQPSSPSPPRDIPLPPHEQYFSHNRPGRPKTSENTFASITPLTHEEYIASREQNKMLHPGIALLEKLHAESFPQWAFELRQGFSLCLYGLGSKRCLVSDFARSLLKKSGFSSSLAVVVNGYNPSASNARELLSSIAIAAHLPPSTISSSSSSSATSSSSSSSAATMATSLLNQLKSNILLIVNSIDAIPLRKPSTQTILSRLASHPLVNLICSADTPDFPLLWDVGLRSAFNFVFHDATTFAPLDAEVSVVDDVNALLGRSTARLRAREGVAFVLRSLPENAKNLFRLLVAEVLMAMDDDDDGGGGGGGGAAVEYRMMYNKAVEEFICSSEMAFRTLLKEFHDHQIITSRKDAVGTELLTLPFPRDELEAMLEDVMD
ncbi:hypothetical protein CP532_3779 [Ophiocordyceps camponoti-leonardi (nom. inval.)]|nr:hypothetical protein CP532_3779 [Ophiocordyceps camponoti-leonardi (nom. inval.)]